MSHAHNLMKILAAAETERARRRDARLASPVGRLVAAEDEAEATIARSLALVARSRELVKAATR